LEAKAARRRRDEPFVIPQKYYQNQNKLKSVKLEITSHRDQEENDEIQK
jgi:hypothetical protein